MTTQEFVEKYNIGTTFEKMYEAQYKANKMKNFTFKDEYFVSDKNTYLEGLRYMLSAYIANKINPKNIDIGVDQEFNFIEFFRDYEDAKRDEFEKSGSIREREPFEGVRDEALNTMKRRLRAFNKSTINVWAEAIKNGAKLDSFRDATIVDGAKYVNPDKKVKKLKIKATYKDITDAGIKRYDYNGLAVETVRESQRTDMLTYAVYEAMKQVRESRSFWWKIWYPNWERNSEEKALMKELEARVKSIGKREKDLLYNQCEMNAVDVEKIYYFDEYVEHPDLVDVLNFNSEEIENENFFELDSGDVESLMNEVKTELGISKENVHFKDDIFNESSVGKIEKIEEHKTIEKNKSIEEPQTRINYSNHRAIKNKFSKKIRIRYAL